MGSPAHITFAHDRRDWEWPEGCQRTPNRRSRASHRAQSAATERRSSPLTGERRTALTLALTGASVRHFGARVPTIALDPGCGQAHTDGVLSELGSQGLSVVVVSA